MGLHLPPPTTEAGPAPPPPRRPRLRSRPAPPPLLPRLHIPAPSPHPSRAALPDAGLSWALSSNLGSPGPRPPSCFDNLWPQSQLSAPLRPPSLSFLRWTPTSLARGGHLDGGQREHGGPGVSQVRAPVCGCPLMHWLTPLRPGSASWAYSALCAGQGAPAPTSGA